MKPLAKKSLLPVFAFILILTYMGTALAADYSVSYDGSADKFVFLPSTDLFDNFKGVMPGDTLTQKVIIKNDVAHGVKVKLYLRAEPAEEKYRDFLSQMTLEAVQQGDSILFSAPACEQGGLASNVYLGTFYSGASIDLNVSLYVPLEMGNEYQNGVGVVNWVFTAEELPIESTDPIPETGDTSSNLILYLSLAGVAMGAIVVLLFVVKAKKGARR